MANNQGVRRSISQENDDHEQAVMNLLNEVWAEWPNWAGFTGLREERGPIQCNIKGTIPSWAAGTLFRTGPGSWQIDDTPTGTLQLDHWFDGLAQSHRFDILPTPDAIGGMSVIYSSRHQSQEFVKHIQEHGNGGVFTFAQRKDPCIGILGKVMSEFQPAKPKIVAGANVENICVAVHVDVPGLPGSPAHASQNKNSDMPGLPNTVWITSDSAKMRRVDPLTLETMEVADQTTFHPDLKGFISCTHAQKCPRTGDFFNFNLELGKQAVYRVFTVSAGTGKTEILATISRPDVAPAYIHSFFLTQNFVILCVPSTHFVKGGIKVKEERNILDAISPFDESQKSHWFIVDRMRGRGVVAEFESDAGFFFHSVNSFEELGTDGSLNIFCDVVEYLNQDILRSLYYDVLVNRNSKGSNFYSDDSRRRGVLIRLGRYRLNIRPNATSASNIKPNVQKAEKELTVLTPHAGELPSINPNFNTRRHRYMYSLCNRGLSSLFDGIVKTDTATREALFWNNEKGHTPGEPIFVPRPGAPGEDDGCLLSLVLDGNKKSSYLLCLDARSMTELGRAEIGLPVGLGFHGLHNRAQPAPDTLALKSHI
ncbi:carotenoid cleavage dioxygenase 1 [Mariannaea sp. PMI_226]|nr:carotenoid cleavage dioxygenase 1 [Mariannaea sp. PMI_226]